MTKSNLYLTRHSPSLREARARTEAETREECSLLACFPLACSVSAFEKILKYFRIKVFCLFCFLFKVQIHGKANTAKYQSSDKH